MSAREKVLVCFRGACTEAADPRGYNRVTHGLYCLSCARLIERGIDAGTPGGSFFPLLDATLTEGGMYKTGLMVVRAPASPKEDQRNPACTRRLQDEGKAYPRTCRVCGLGKCTEGGEG